MHEGQMVGAQQEQVPPQPVVSERVVSDQPENGQEERPVSLFEQTARDIVKEYNEVAGWHAQSEALYGQIEASIGAVEAEFEKYPLYTPQSEEITLKYRRLIIDRDAVKARADALRERATKLWMDYAPFQKITEARTGLQESENMISASLARQTELQRQETILRSEWAGFEATASKESAVIEEEDEQIAGEQRKLTEQIEEARERLLQYEYFRPYTENPQYAANYTHVKTFFDQMDPWIQQAETRLAGLGAMREQIHVRRQALRGRREQILSSYNAVMQEQADLVEKMTQAKQGWQASQAQELEGIAQAEEVLRSRSN